MRNRYDTLEGRHGYSRGAWGNKVPIHSIEIMWHEGLPSKQQGGKKFTGDNVWLDYQKAMEQIDKDNRGDRPKGTYTKTKARFTWADGTQREARMDLGPNDYNPKKEYIGDYYQKTLRDGKRGEDGRWKAFSPPKYIKSRTGRELGVGTYYHAQGLKKNIKGKASQKEQPEEVFGSYSSKGHRPQKSKPYSSKGPGSGWHGQIARHRMAAMKGRR